MTHLLSLASDIPFKERDVKDWAVAATEREVPPAGGGRCVMGEGVEGGSA
jgi:hypothetical protein